MKLLLTSTGLTNINVRGKFISLFEKDFSNTKVLFVTSASESPRQEWYVNQSREELLELGIKEENFVEYHDGDKPSKDVLDEIDLIYVCGGNTFHLLEELKKSSLDKDIIEMIKKDIFYIGASAGSIIVTPTIGVAKPWDSNDRELKDLSGFSLINFTLVPHYENKDEETIIGIERELGVEIKRITDDQAVLVLDDGVMIIK